MTAIRDSAIWAAAKGKKTDVAAADAKTKKLPPVATNYDPGQGDVEAGYLYGKDALDKIKVAKGYKLELFASEKEFADLANPVQLSFDNRGTTYGWPAMPTYPHYRPGDPVNQMISY